MMCCEPDSCCCCVSLRTGSKCLAIFTMVLNILQLIVLEVVAIIYLAGTLSEAVINQQNLLFESALIIFPVPMYLYQIYVAVLMYQGIQKRKPALMLYCVSLQKYFLVMAATSVFFILAYAIIYEKYLVLISYCIYIIVCLLWGHFISVAETYSQELQIQCNNALITSGQIGAVCIPESEMIQSNGGVMNNDVIIAPPPMYEDPLKIMTLPRPFTTFKKERPLSLDSDNSVFQKPFSYLPNEPAPDYNY